MENVQEKLDRKTIEKNRRVYMKGLISQLISLVPPHHFNPPKNMLSQHDQIEQVASYIKQLSEKVEELKKRRNQLITSTSLKNPIYDHPSSAAFPVVKVSESGSTLEVVIVSETKKNFFLHQVVKIIEEGGAEVVSVSISTSPHNIIHIFHAQVKVARFGIDSSMISDRLQALIGQFS